MMETIAVLALPYVIDGLTLAVLSGIGFVITKLGLEQHVQLEKEQAKEAIEAAVIELLPLAAKLKEDNPDYKLKPEQREHLESMALSLATDLMPSRKGLVSLLGRRVVTGVIKRTVRQLKPKVRRRPASSDGSQRDLITAFAQAIEKPHQDHTPLNPKAE